MTISTPGRGDAAILEMRRILSAIEAGDPEAAYAATMDHLGVVKDLARKALEGIDSTELSAYSARKRR